MSRVILINSIDAINNRITLDEPIEGMFALELFSMNNSLYNVNATNDEFYANSVAIALTNGSYIGLELKTLLESALQSEFSDATITVTYDANTGKFTILSPSTSLALEFGSNTLNSSRKLYGFSETDTATSTTNVSQNVASLSPYNAIFLSFHQDDQDAIQGKNHFVSSFVLFDLSSSFTGTIRMTSHDLFQTIVLSRTKTLKWEFHSIDDEPIEFNGAEYFILLKHIPEFHK